MSKNSFAHTANARPARSTLIPASKRAAATQTAIDESPQALTEDDARARPPRHDVPRDVALAIERTAEADRSDPFLAGRLAAHYRQGIWQPTHIAKKK